MVEALLKATGGSLPPHELRGVLECAISHVSPWAWLGPCELRSRPTASHACKHCATCFPRLLLFAIHFQAVWDRSFDERQRRLNVLKVLFSDTWVRAAARQPDHQGRTSLFYAAERGRLAALRVFEFLVSAARELGVDINHQVGGW